MEDIKKIVPGLSLSLVVAFIKIPSNYSNGIKFASKNLLKYAIILLGFSMNLFNVVKVGSQSMVLTIFTILTAFIVAFIVA